MEIVISPLLEHAVRPLLRLARIVTGAEWVFIPSIAREKRRNRTASLPPPTIDGPCFPVVAGGLVVGQMRCANGRTPSLDAYQLEAVQLIAATMQQLLESEHDRSHAWSSAAAATLVAEEALGASRRDALHSQQMQVLAFTDALTGLPNRRAFMQRWVDALARSRGNGHGIGLMLIDADRFKAINDSRGHATGDAILRAVGSALLSIASSPDHAARIGGDEFALFSLHSDGPRLHALAAAVRARFRELATELGVDATLSIGMASSETCSTGDLFAHADLALYLSKEAGGDADRLYGRNAAPTGRHAVE